MVKTWALVLLGLGGVMVLGGIVAIGFGGFSAVPDDITENDPVFEMEGPGEATFSLNELQFYEVFVQGADENTADVSVIDSAGDEVLEPCADTTCFDGNGWTHVGTLNLFAPGQATFNVTGQVNVAVYEQDLGAAFAGILGGGAACCLGSILGLVGLIGLFTGGGGEQPAQIVVLPGQMPGQQPGMEQQGGWAPQGGGAAPVPAPAPAAPTPAAPMSQAPQQPSDPWGTGLPQQPQQAQQPQRDQWGNPLPPHQAQQPQQPAVPQDDFANRGW